MQYINIFNNILAIMECTFGIYGVITFISKAIQYCRRIRYIKKVLGYNRDTVQIYHSTFELLTDENQKNIFVTEKAILSVDNVIALFRVAKLKFSLIGQDNEAINEMCIGGFIPNKRVNSYFSQFFPEFKYCAKTKFRDKYEKLPINTQIFEYAENKTGFRLNQDTFLETNSQKDYAFLIKLTSDDFNTTTKKTVHILFGGRDIGTLKATEYLRTQYKEIYKKYKNKHYFFAIEINLVDNSFNQRTGIIDLSDIMFKDKKLR